MLGWELRNSRERQALRTRHAVTTRNGTSSTVTTTTQALPSCRSTEKASETQAHPDGHQEPDACASSRDYVTHGSTADAPANELAAGDRHAPHRRHTRRRDACEARVMERSGCAVEAAAAEVDPAGEAEEEHREAEERILRAEGQVERGLLARLRPHAHTL